MILNLEAQIQQAKTSPDNKTILYQINNLNTIFFEFANELKIETQLKQFNDKIRELISGLREEQKNLSLLMNAPKMEKLLYNKAQEFLNFLEQVIIKLKTDVINQ